MTTSGQLTATLAQTRSNIRGQGHLVPNLGFRSPSLLHRRALSISREEMDDLDLPLVFARWVLRLRDPLRLRSMRSRLCRMDFHRGPMQSWLPLHARNLR